MHKRGRIVLIAFTTAMASAVLMTAPAPASACTVDPCPPDLPPVQLHSFETVTVLDVGSPASLGVRYSKPISGQQVFDTEAAALFSFSSDSQS